MNIKQVTLWSFLTQSSAKQEIICPTDLRVTIEEFSEHLKQQLQENQLPASAELTQVNWDGTNTSQKLILVRYTDNQASTNVLQFAVGLEQLGRFAYLEKKIYLNPPKLPPLIEGKTHIGYQQKKEEGDVIDGAIGCGVNAVLGVIGAVAGLIGWAAISFGAGGVGVFFLAVTLLMCVLIIKNVGDDDNKKQTIKKQNLQVEQQNQKTRKQNDEIDRWNAQKQKRDKERQAIFDRWHREALEVAYLSQTTDVFGRWTSAVSTTIDQVVQQLFIERQAQAKQWEEERKSKEELEKLLKERNAEAFG